LLKNWENIWILKFWEDVREDGISNGFYVLLFIFSDDLRMHQGVELHNAEEGLTFILRHCQFCCPSNRAQYLLASCGMTSDELAYHAADESKHGRAESDHIHSPGRQRCHDTNLREVLSETQWRPKFQSSA
jgi:hypothetical protein